MSFVPPIDKKDAKRRLAKLQKTFDLLNAEKRDAADAGYALGVKAIDEKIRDLKLYDAIEFYASFLDTENNEESAVEDIPVTKMTMDPGVLEADFTSKLLAANLSSKNDGTFHRAIISGGYHAKKLGKTIYVYSGNSMGHRVWRAGLKKSDCLSYVNNDGNVCFSIEPDLTVRKHFIKR